MGHYDSQGWCRCWCGYCAPVGCGRAGTVGRDGCDVWDRDGARKPEPPTITDKRAGT